ncbi:molybdopterin cofactor-binding domain-containing protein [Roseomonas harenae]|uniref:molybdopterin cofactor-binding domain-containing protein n=1 Tax=Muricoccus harenae TaxID=2692566 RepID=UPI0022A7A08D|nr:molybdopterin cofactor-binding domain-containing protein [Roseomonas harenae]
MRDNLARHALKVPPEMLRVVSPDVGGGFGVRGKLMPENAMVLWAARRLGQSVKWLAGRTETFQSDPHGRDQVTRAEMALDEGPLPGRPHPHPRRNGGPSAGHGAARADLGRGTGHGHGL